MMIRLPQKISFLQLMVVALLSTPGLSFGTESPDLVVLIAVDQLRRDRLNPMMPGGLGELVRNGRNYVEAVHDHALTSTCPGHTAIATGKHPAHTGITSNDLLDVVDGKISYCVSDDNDGARVFGRKFGRSPNRIRASSIGDWLKDVSSGSRVISIAGKDRSAIPMGGHTADAAIWYDHDQGILTTSAFYSPELPESIRDFNRQIDFPHAWQAPTTDTTKGFWHPIKSSSRKETLSNYWDTPFVDKLLLDFARRMLKEEDLGNRGHADILALGLSGTDAVGHDYGPFSEEAEQALALLDGWLGEFLDDLQEHVISGKVLVVLTADHGVMARPEHRPELNTCPVPGGRQNAVNFVLRALLHVHWKFGPWFSIPGKLVRSTGFQIGVMRPFAERHDIDPAVVVADLEEWLEQQDIVAEAWNRDEILNGTDEFARLHRNAYDLKRPVDLILQLQKTCVLRGSGTEHGSPYDYDRDVPIVFYGWGVERATVRGPARTIDIAPTIAHRLNVPVPSDLDGRPLP